MDNVTYLKASGLLEFHFDTGKVWKTAKSIKLYPDIDKDTGVSLAHTFAQTCADRIGGRNGVMMCVDNVSYWVYQTKTMYIVRKA